MGQIFSKPMPELVDLRHSVRNYTQEPLSNELIDKIEDYIATVDNPFHKKVTIQLIDKSSLSDNVKLGTYGAIKGANYFFVTSCEDDEISRMALGYSLEKVVLYCTSLGLGTVWLGGTFTKSSFAKTIGLDDHHIIPIVIPVGYEGGTKTLLGKLFGNNTNRRKDMSEVLFENTFETPMLPDNLGIFMGPFEMLRLAPSAVNKQPWRVLKVENVAHFYLASTKPLNYVDMGIALCHFDLSAQELGLEGKFYVEENPVTNSLLKYIISWKLMK